MDTSSKAKPGEQDVLEKLAAKGKRLCQGAYCFRRIQRPGTIFSEDEQKCLLQLIIRESSHIYRTDTSPYWNERSDYFKDILELWMVEHQGLFKGWCGLSVWKTPFGPILYLDTLNIRPALSRRGVTAMLFVAIWTRLAWEHKALLSVAMRTQSPVVFKLCESLEPRSVFPNLRGKQHRLMNQNIIGMALYAAQKTSPGSTFDPNTFIVRRAYGRPLYGYELPEMGDEKIDSFFRKKMKVSEGDGVIIIGHASLGWAIKYGLFGLALHLGNYRPEQLNRLVHLFLKKKVS